MRKILSICAFFILGLMIIGCELPNVNNSSSSNSSNTPSNITKYYTAGSNTFALNRSKTIKATSSNSAFTSFISTNYGTNYRMADWNDLKTLSSSQVQALMTSLGMVFDDANIVTRNNSHFYAGSNRHYYVSRHNGNCPSYFLDHDDLHSHAMSLGSWYDTYPVLVVKNAASTGVVTGTVIDATTGSGIMGVTVRSGSVSSSTNSVGRFSLTLNTGTHTLTFTKTGYNIESINVTISTGGSTTTIPSSSIVANPSITASGTWRIVLTWGENPSDLDSHLKTPSNQHIYYSNKTQAGCSARLDRDDTSSYGPETITINPIVSGTYKYYVHKFSGSGNLSTSNATVKLYNSSGLYRTYNVPTSGSGVYWNVFEIRDGSIVTKNTLQSTAP